jgi:hypothetical protein
MQNKLPMHLSRRYGAQTRSGSRCRSPAMPNGRCRLHGGISPGAPRGNKNAPKLSAAAAQGQAENRPPPSCALLHLCLGLHGSLTLIQYDFVKRKAERLCCSTGEVVRRLLEAAMRVVSGR